MKKIAVHAGALVHQAPSGIGYYTYHLLKALSELDRKNQYVLLSGKPLHNCLDGIPSAYYSPSSAFSYLGFQRGARKEKAEIALVLKEIVPPFLKIPTIIASYDLYYLFAPRAVLKEVPPSAKLFYQLAVRFHFSRAAKILAISENTKRELIEYAQVDPEKIVVTSPACDRTLFRPYPMDKIQCIQAKYRIEHPYFINVSSRWYARKNLLCLIEAFNRRLSKHFSLVVTGKRGPSYSEMVSKGKSLILLENVPREDLPLLLAGAQALVFPSLHEGFGMPVVEAMACGCPVVTSNLSALPEVAGGAALLVDPYSVESIEEAMLKLCEDRMLRQTLIQHGFIRAMEFTWEKSAAAALKIIEDVSTLI